MSGAVIQYVIGDATRPKPTTRRSAWCSVCHHLDTKHYTFRCSENSCSCSGFTRDAIDLIVHIVNDIGAFGRGFVVPLARAFPLAKTSYRYWYEHRADRQSDFSVTADAPFELGSVKFARIARTTEVAHMIAQHGIRTSPPPIRYDALEKCLGRVAEYAEKYEMPIHMPRIGCGLAGGTWDRVEQIIEKTLCARDLSVTVYDLPER